MAGWLDFRRALARRICPELAGMGHAPRPPSGPRAVLPPADAESIGGRLRAERVRLGLSQTAFGKIGGVGKQSQQNYEGGRRFPDAHYLAAIAAAGADILYIVTGVSGFSASKRKTSRQDGVSPDIPRPDGAAVSRDAADGCAEVSGPRDRESGPRSWAAFPSPEEAAAWIAAASEEELGAMAEWYLEDRPASREEHVLQHQISRKRSLDSTSA